MSEGTHDTTPQPNGSSLAGAKDSALSSAQSTMDAVQNHPFVQDVSSTVQDGAVGQAVKNQKDKTAAEFDDLRSSKVVPEQPAATGQPLTQYHSLGYRLLSWKNPRATSIAFLTTVAFIFASRYLHVERFVLKYFTYLLGISALAEIAGKATLGHGLTTQFRPRKYFTIPRESLERFLDDAEQLINFIVIEFQRIIFAENVYVTVGALFASLSSFLLIKLLPFWGLSLILTCVVYLGPLVYVTNKDFIDGQLNTANDIFNKQAAQVREVTGQYTGKASEQVRAYSQQASSQISGLVGQAKAKTSSNSSDLPNAPKTAPFPDTPSQDPVHSTSAIAPEPVNAKVYAHVFHNMAAAAVKGVGNATRSCDDKFFEQDILTVDSNRYATTDMMTTTPETLDTSSVVAAENGADHVRQEAKRSASESEVEQLRSDFFEPEEITTQSRQGEAQHRTGYGDGITYDSVTADEEEETSEFLQV